jgi:hypothetical protein
MMPNRELLRHIKQLYKDGWSKQQLRDAGFNGMYICEAIRQVDQSWALPTENTRVFRCKKCRHKVYENYLRGGVCKGCEIRQQVNEERNGAFQV